MVPLGAQGARLEHELQPHAHAACRIGRSWTNWPKPAPGTDGSPREPVKRGDMRALFKHAAHLIDGDASTRSRNEHCAAVSATCKRGGSSARIWGAHRGAEPQ